MKNRIIDEKGRFVKVLSEEESKKRKYENSKNWALKNKERRSKIVKKSRSRPEYKAKQALNKKERYYKGLDLESRNKYQKSEKGIESSKKAKIKWVKQNPEKRKIQQAELRENLSDCYIIQKIRRGTNITAEILRENPEIIETKRIIIKTKRLCKTSKSLETV